MAEGRSQGFAQRTEVRSCLTARAPCMDEVLEMAPLFHHMVRPHRYVRVGVSPTPHAYIYIYTGLKVDGFGCLGDFRVDGAGKATKKPR